MSPTRSLVLSGTATTAAMLAAYGLLRAFGHTASSASIVASWIAPVVFAAAAAAALLAARSLSTEASSAIVAAGATMIATFMAASRPTNVFGLLLLGFFLGIAFAVFALMKDLDERTSPKLLMAVPMAQLFALLVTFGR